MTIFYGVGLVALAASLFLKEGLYKLIGRHTFFATALIIALYQSSMAGLPYMKKELFVVVSTFLFFLGLNKWFDYLEANSSTK